MSAGLVCLPCRLFYRIKKTGVAIEEGMPLGPMHDGTSERWGPYKLWMGDLYECPSCGAQLVTGFGRNPLAEHYQSDYERQRDRFAPLARIDCCGGARP